MKPRSAGSHVVFPEDLARAARRKERLEILGYVIAIFAILLIVVLVADPPPPTR